MFEGKAFPLYQQLGQGQLTLAACINPEDLLLDISGGLRKEFWVEREKGKNISKPFWLYNALHHGTL